MESAGRGGRNGTCVRSRLSGFGGRDVEQEGTLVRMEAPLESGLVPAFVTNPASVVVDEAL